MLKNEVGGKRDSVNNRAIYPVGKLLRVKRRGSDRLEVLEKQTFKDFHDHRGQCHRSAVVERGDFRLLRYGDYDGALEALNNLTELERGVNDDSEERRQLYCIVLY